MKYLNEHITTIHQKGIAIPIVYALVVMGAMILWIYEWKGYSSPGPSST